MKIFIIGIFISNIFFMKSPVPEIKDFSGMQCKTFGNIQQATMKNCLKVNLKSAGMNTHLNQNLDYFIFKMDGTFLSKSTVKITSNPQLVPLTNVASNTNYQIICDLSSNNSTAANFTSNVLKTFNTGTLPCRKQQQTPNKKQN